MVRVAVVQRLRRRRRRHRSCPRRASSRSTAHELIGSQELGVHQRARAARRRRRRGPRVPGAARRGQRTAGHRVLRPRRRRRPRDATSPASRPTRCWPSRPRPGSRRCSSWGSRSCATWPAPTAELDVLRAVGMRPRHAAHDGRGRSDARRRRRRRGRSRRRRSSSRTGSRSARPRRSSPSPGRQADLSRAASVGFVAGRGARGRWARSRRRGWPAAPTPTPASRRPSRLAGDRRSARRAGARWPSGPASRSSAGADRSPCPCSRRSSARSSA